MISVIVPVYKVERYLRQCLDSICNQTYRDLEILIIDDGSPDKCGDICEEYAQKDKRVRVFHTENKGLSAARNLGLLEAKGEYIGFVDSDDWIDPDMYEVLLQRLKETGTDISTCGLWKEYQKNRFSESICDVVFVGTETIRSLVCKRICNLVWDKLYKRKTWEGISFPENHNYEDIATTYKVILQAYSVSSTSKILYHYRMRDNSIIHHPMLMKNLMDYWFASYEKYSYLSVLPQFRNDQEIICNLEKQIALAAIVAWRWAYSVPKEQRDYAFLKRVSCFIKKKIPVFGKRNWGILMRLAIFFPRYANWVSFTFSSAANYVYCIIKKSSRTPFTKS